MSETTETVYDLHALEQVAGPTAKREFEASLPAFQPDLWDWAMVRLPAMDNRTFVQQAAAAIYDSANMNRFRGMDHVHFKASAAHTESERRHTLAHPDEACHATSLYQRAFNNAVRDAGHAHMASEIRPCTCTPTTDAADVHTASAPEAQ